MTNKQQKINLFKKLGNQLLKSGRKFLTKAFKVKLQKTTKQYVKQLVKSKTGIVSIWSADLTYRYTDLDTVKDILKYDLVDEREYLDDGRLDCDKFATAIYHRFRWIYGINTMALARSVETVDAKTGQHINWHRANVFVALDNQLKVFYLEPQTDYIAELTGKEVVIGSRKYILNTIDF